MVHAQQTEGEFRLDHDRLARTGIAEAVYAPGKSPEQCAEAVAGLLAGGDGPVLLTRADAAQAAAALGPQPGGTTFGPHAHLAGAAAPDRHARSSSPRARATCRRPARPEPCSRRTGTTPTWSRTSGSPGCTACSPSRSAWPRADVVLVVAGMEGALASVVAGLTAAPVIAVPTSTGYGAGLEGVTALLGMMASCSPGVTVVGIDNGFGAACAAVRILRTMP